MNLQSKKYPFDTIRSLHEKYAPSDKAYDLVLTHCIIVHDIAMQLIEKNELAVNIELVTVGALLHDIGAYPLIDAAGILRKGTAYVRHGVEGENILKHEGYPETVWRFASHHTGVGLTKEDIANFDIPIPITDYLAETDEELLVMYADKFHSKVTPPVFNSYEWYRNDVKRFGEDKVTKFDAMAKKFGFPDLNQLSKQYQCTIR